MRLTVSPTVVGTLFDVCSWTVIGPRSAVVPAFPATGPVVKTSFVGAAATCSSCVAEVNEDALTVMVTEPDLVSP